LIFSALSGTSGLPERLVFGTQLFGHILLIVTMSSDYMSPRLTVCLFWFVTTLSTQCQQKPTGTVTEQVEVTAENVQLIVERDEIKAGDVFEFTVTLDRAPNFSGGLVQYDVAGPQHVKAVGNCTPTLGKPREYKCELRVPAVGPAGVWKIRSVYFSVGNKIITLIRKPVEFSVLPNPDVVLPTTAELTINISQAQLLRKEAARLQERIQSLKAAISNFEVANRKGEVTPLLRENLRAAMAALGTTQAEFVELAAARDQTANAEIFFSDLRTSYEDALAEVEKGSAHPSAMGFLLLVANESYGRSTDALVAAALRPLEQNELAYSVVANAGSLTFDLEVDSNPPGATVSYHRRGDQPHAHPNPTNSTIHSLPYAIWITRFEKPGYRAEEREHDPFRELNHVVNVQLEH
jgi:hypothetical protein